MLQFLHLSDLHLHRHDANNVEAVKVLDYAGAHYPQHHLVVTGDITDDGHPEQYAQAARLLKPWQGRLFLCPGNHDFGAAGNFFSPERAHRFDTALSTPLRQGGLFAGDNLPVTNVVHDGDTSVLIIALDTNLETEDPFDFACGEVGKKQLRSLDTLLGSRSVSGMTKILLLHHHPFMHGHPFMELKDAARLMRVCHQRVDVMMFGHKHVSAMWQGRCDIPYILAADNSPGKDWAREVTVRGREVSVEDVKISMDAVE